MTKPNEAVKLLIIDNSPLTIKGVQGDTKDGEIIITLPKGSGKYNIDIIPLEATK